MFLLGGWARRDLSRFPRVSGDVPVTTYTKDKYTSFSPRERGCSVGVLLDPPYEVVFPA